MVRQTALTVWSSGSVLAQTPLFGAHMIWIGRIVFRIIVNAVSGMSITPTSEIRCSKCDFVQIAKYIGT